jgi:UDP-N-acetylglucosamine acyltransferase
LSGLAAIKGCFRRDFLLRERFQTMRISELNQTPGIHPTATVSGEVRLEEGATIGPYCVVEGRVRIGFGSKVLAHSVVQGTTFIGAGCRLGPHAAVGTDPQHHRYDGSETYLVIGDQVTIREFATVHRATQTGLENATRVGCGSLLMVGSHVAHDCCLGEHVTLANAVHLGGHVMVGDRATIGGGTVIHQFVRIGRLAMIAGGEALAKDVLPFGAVIHSAHKGYNAIGCHRAGLNAQTIHALRGAFREIHSHRSVHRAAMALQVRNSCLATPELCELIDFISSSRRGIQPSASAATTTNDEVA